jgi:uncharacterized protein (TIGR02611 family)
VAWVARTESSSGGFMGRMSALRDRARSTRAGRIAWRTAVTVLGVAIIVGGIVLLPLPGPGWLIIFAGLGLLATEYEWASRLLRFARAKVSAWTDWVATRSRPMQALIGLAGLLILAGALWVAYWYYTR